MYPKKNKYLQIINYLKEYSKLRERTVYDIERSQKYQAIIWNQDIPLDDDINFLFNSPPEENNSTILSIRRPIEPSPPIFPEPSETLKPWINKETLKDYENNPILLTPSQNEHIKLNAASDYGKIEKQFSDYLATEWLNWSKKYKLFLPEFQKYEQKKKVYFKLFEAFNKIRSFPESLELILGIGLFKYLSENLAINRHILNFKLDIEFMDSGLINLFLKGDEISLSIETEMLSPLVNENLFIPRATNHLKEKVLEKELFEAIKIYDLKKALSGFVNSLSPDAKFQDQNDKPFNYYQKPIISFSPAIILRRKSQKGYVHVYENIFQEIESEENPNIPLFDSFIGDLGSHSSIESDYVPRDIKIRGDSNSRAILFPKKYNKEQVKIIKQSRKKNRVLVQGPPGTGKSHTIANLICNILSEGKNILVTAQTNRALEVLINHIPESFHQLVVFLLEVGNRGETTLGKSIKGLQDSLNDASLVQLEKQINNSHEKLDSLKRRKAELNNRLLDVIESDSRNVFIKNYGNASLIKHAKKIKADSYKNEWVLDEIKDLEGAETLIPQLIKLATEIKNISKIEYSPFDYWVPKNEDLISLDNYKLFRSKLKEYHSEFKEIKRSKVTKIPFHTIKTFQKLITNLNKRFELFELDDFYSNSYKQLALNKTKWNHIFSECEKLLVNKNREFLNKKKDNVCFYPKNKSKKQILADTKVIYEFVSQGNKLTGFLKPYTLPKQIKDRKYVFHDISLNSHPVTTLSRLNWLIDDLEIQILLVDIGQLLNIPITRIDINEFLDIQDRFTHLKELNRISIDNEILTTELSEIFNKPKTYFDNHIEVRKLSKFINASQLAHQIIPLEKAFRESLDYLESSSFEIHPLLSKMKDNFKKLDVNFYENQLAAIDELEKQKLIYLKKKEYKNQLIDFFPHLINQMEDIEFVQNVNEDILLEGFRWKNADQILKSYLGESTININKEIKGIENEILEKSESLLLNQAILKFIQKIPSRDSLISLLQKWQKAIEQGKRSGKRAQRYKRDAKLILSQIKDQIPCWVIPMHSLTETLAPKPELFDYIIVDEASQIGAEGIFLNYITKNIIIVGDDKQTSPQTVGVKVDEINQLIDIHLTEFPSKNFFGTENSFFDHAKMTSGVSIVLTEHFRCMPEIIEFCNQEFYAPEGINLIPLRPFSTNRLAPLKCKFVQTGYAENHNNIPEAEALVEEMKKCIENPLYKGKTMGVITLLGNRQASRIEKLIEQKIDTKEILERKIICGKASNFQGDERDIVFLSLVSAPNEKGTAIISNKNRKQEYNVAVSRAKDQLWLFHSIKTSDFGHGDLRSRLVQHFYTERKLEEG
ncbi:MAG: AAA domain-containing protein, partial [Saprospiraceae bacterium]|nr:AAA domain-containing protein [Saprospiraceae bacterium]